MLKVMFRVRNGQMKVGKNGMLEPVEWLQTIKRLHEPKAKAVRRGRRLIKKLWPKCTARVHRVLRDREGEKEEAARNA